MSLSTETALYKPVIRRSIGRDEEAVTQPSSPSTSDGSHMASTGVPVIEETHNFQQVALPALRQPTSFERQQPTTFEVFAGLPAGASSSFISTIQALPDDQYELSRPIPVCIEQIEGKEFVACFERAGLAMSAETLEESLKRLSEHLLDALEVFGENEKTLGPVPAAQLDALRQFIREKRRG